MVIFIAASTFRLRNIVDLKEFCCYFIPTSFRFIIKFIAVSIFMNFKNWTHVKLKFDFNLAGIQPIISTSCET